MSSSRLRGVTFCALTGEDIIRLSAIEVENPGLRLHGQPVKDGLFDLHMGPSEMGEVCANVYCGNNKEFCPGHFGYIRLAAPVYNTAQVIRSSVAHVLNSVCSYCGSLLLDRKVAKAMPGKFVKRLVQISKRIAMKGRCEACFASLGFYPSQPEYASDPAEWIVIRGDYSREHILSLLHNAKQGKKRAVVAAAVASVALVKQEKADAAAADDEDSNDDNETDADTEANTEVDEGDIANVDDEAVAADADVNVEDEDDVDHEENLDHEADDRDEVEGEGTGETAKQKREKRQKGEPFPAEDAFRIISSVSAQDAALLGFGRHFPITALIWTIIPVIPPCDRPTVRATGLQARQYELTILYTRILTQNKVVQTTIDKGVTDKYREHHATLTEYVRQLYDNKQNTNHRSIGYGNGKAYESIYSLISGKKARIRFTLFGSRCNNSGRNVITGEGKNRLNVVTIGTEMAIVMTTPETVRRDNIQFLYSLVANGPNKYPGAKFIHRADGTKIRLGFAQATQDIVLNIGDIVHRHIMTDDICCFNRQPTLHGYGFMGFRVKVANTKTQCFNECVCAPFNADFDGDEMNIHFPQSMTAKAEVEYMMNITNNLISVANNKTIIGLILNSITGLYLLTRHDTFLTKREAELLLSEIRCFDGQLPKPDKVEGKKELYSGRTLISILLPCINLSKASAIKDESLETDNDNGQVTIKNGKLISGVLDKAAFGNGKNNTIQQILYLDYGGNEAIELMHQVQTMVSAYLELRGFTFGVRDVHIPAKQRELIHAKIREVEEQCMAKLQEIDAGRVITPMHETTAEMYERMAMGILSGGNAPVYEIIRKWFHEHGEKDNSLACMVYSGAKGGKAQTLSMIGCVGQQVLPGGKRAQPAFNGRVNVYSFKDDFTPFSRGFVNRSFVEGYLPPSYHHIADPGKKALVDTNQKTQDTGYIERRNVMGMLDLFVAYDLTVRNSNGALFCYNNGAHGCKINRIEDVKIELIKYSDADIRSKLLIPGWAGNVEEENALFAARGLLRSLFMRDKIYAKLEDTVHIPLNMNRIIGNVSSIEATGSAITPLALQSKREELIRTVRALFNLRGDPRSEEMMKLVEVSIRFALSSKRVRDEGLPPAAIDLVAHDVKVALTRAIVGPGEMIGIRAGQSMGEKASQMSFTYGTEIMLIMPERMPYMVGQQYDEKLVKLLGKAQPSKWKLGEFVDECLANCGNIQTIGETGAEVCDVHWYPISCMTVDSKGNVFATPVDAVTRHPPNGKLVRVTCESGRVVEATLAKSFIVNADEHPTYSKVGRRTASTTKVIRLLPIEGSKVKVGMHLPFSDRGQLAFDRIVEVVEFETTDKWVYDITVKSTLNFMLYNGLFVRDTLNTFHAAGSSKSAALTGSQGGIGRLNALLMFGDSMSRGAQMTVFLRHGAGNERHRAQTLANSIQMMYVKDFVVEHQIWNEQTGDPFVTNLPQDQGWLTKFRKTSVKKERTHTAISNYYLRVAFDRAKLYYSQMRLDQIAQKIVEYYGSKVVVVHSDDNDADLVLRVYFVPTNIPKSYDQEKIARDFLAVILNKILLRGIDGIIAASVAESTLPKVTADGSIVMQKEYIVETVGSNMVKVLGLADVDPVNTYTNDAKEMYRVFGVEAACTALIRELRKMFEYDNSAYLNEANYRVLVSMMTFPGAVASLSRMGIMKDKTLMPACAAVAFEETPKMLIEAALNAQQDSMSVTASVLFGQRMPGGSGVCNVLYDAAETGLKLADVLNVVRAGQ